jgi:hypothetical protein
MNVLWNTEIILCSGHLLYFCMKESEVLYLNWCCFSSLTKE